MGISNVERARAYRAKREKKEETSSLSSNVERARAYRLQNQLPSSNDILNESLSSWQDASTMSANRNKVQNTYNNLKAYMDEYGSNLDAERSKNMSTLLGAYESALGDWDNRASLYSNYLNADAFNAAKKTNALDEKYKGYSYDEIQKALKTAKGEEADYLKNYSNYSSLADYDKAMLYSSGDTFDKLQKDRIAFEDRSRKEAKLNVFDEKYRKLMQNADFEQNSDPSSIIDIETGAGLNVRPVDRYYGIENKDVLDRGIGSGAYNASYLFEMDEDAQRVGAYIYNTQGKKAYLQYINDMDYATKTRRAEEQREMWSQYGEEHPVLTTLANMVASPVLGAVGGFEQMISGSDAISRTAGVSSAMQNATSEISQRIREEHGDLPAFAYDVLNTGVPNRVGQFMFGGAYNLVMGMSSFANTYANAIQSGENTTSAIMDAFVAGAIETITEQIGMDWAWGKGKYAITQALKQSLAEGSEEVVGAIAEAVYQATAKGAESDYNRNVKKYMEMGYSEFEAKSRASADFAQDVAYQFAVAAASTAPTGGVQAFATEGMGRNVDRSAFAYAMGNTTDQDYLDLLNSYNGDLSQATNLEMGRAIQQATFDDKFDKFKYFEKSLDNEAKREVTKGMKTGKENTDAEGNTFEVASAKRKGNDTIVITENGEEKNLNDVTLTEDDAFRVSQALTKQGEMNTLYNELYDGQDVVRYDANFEMAEHYGKMGYDTTELVNSIDKNVLPASAALKIYNAARVAEAQQTQKIKAANDVTIKNWNGKYKSGRLDTTEIKDIKLSKDEKRFVAFADVLAKLGMNIKIIKDAKQENGITYQNGDIVINLVSSYTKITSKNTGNTKYAVATLAHETTHMMKNILGSEYNEYKELVRKTMGKEWDTMIQKRMDAHNIDEEVAADEVVARFSEDMFNDGTVLDRLLENASTNQIEKILRAIKRWFAEVSRDFKEWMKGYESASPEAKMARATLEGFKEAQDMWVSKLERALALKSAQEKTLAEAGVEMIKNFAYSARTLAESWAYVETRAVKKGKGYTFKYDEAQLKQATDVLVAQTGWDNKKAEKFLKDINSVAAIETQINGKLKYEDIGTSSWVSNSDYGGNFDFSYLCPKRLVYTGTLQEIHKRIKEPMTFTQFIALRKFLLKNKYQAPCSFCYVEASRRDMDKYVKEKFLDVPANKKYNLTLEQLTNADFLEELRSEYIRTGKDNGWVAFNKAMNKLGNAKPKQLEKRRAYRGEILTSKDFKNEDKVKAMNKKGGIRFFAFSDFEVPHMLDLMQVILDMSTRKLAGFAYTKQKEFAEVFGSTGLKIDLSCVAKGVDENGNLIFDDIEGMNHEDAIALRNKYSENVGIVCVIFTDEQAEAAMKNPNVDYILPFHASGMAEEFWDFMGLPAGTHNYTTEQTEKSGNEASTKAEGGNIHPLEYWDYSKSGRENAQAYLDIINERGMTPVFRRFLKHEGGKEIFYKNGNHMAYEGGKWVLPEGEIGDNYYKLIIEQKMYDNNGVGAPQQAVVPRFNMDRANELAMKYEGGHDSFPVAYDVVDEFMEWHNKGEGLFSERVTEDSEGINLSEGQIRKFGNSKALDKEGRLQRVFHGTVREFYEFKRQFSNSASFWGKGFYFSNNLDDVEENYANENGADLTQKIELEAERLENSEEYEDKTHDEIVDELRQKYITAEEPITLECYLDIENPCYPNTWLFDSLVPDISEDDFETEDEYYDAIDEAYRENVDSELEYVIGYLEDNFDDYEVIDAYRDKIVEILATAIGDGGVQAGDLRNQFANEVLGDWEGNDVSNEITRLIIQSLGYDGIIDNTVATTFPYMNLDADTVHYIVFDSDQAKLTSNLNPTNNPDIRKSERVENWHDKGYGRFEVKAQKSTIDYLLNFAYTISKSEYSILNSAVLINNDGVLNPNTIGCETTENNLYIYVTDSKRKLYPIYGREINEIDRFRDDLGEEVAEELSRLWDESDGSGADAIPIRQRAKYRDIAEKVREVIERKQRGSLPVGDRGSFGNRNSERLAEDGLVEVNPHKIGLTDEKLEYLVSSSAYGAGARKTKSYMVYMSPMDFLKLTTGRNMHDLEYVSKWETGDGYDGTPYNLEKTKANKDYTINLKVDFSNNEVVGHEGRHRMAQLDKMGYSKVPVRIQEYLGEWKDREDIASVDLLPQGFGERIYDFNRVEVKNLIALQASNLDKLKEVFGDSNDAGYHFSERVEDKETLDFLNRQIDNGEYITTYKAMSNEGTKKNPILHSPMAKLINGKYENDYELGKWYKAVEHPELIKNGNQFPLNKGKNEVKALGSIDARYNPYEHSANTLLNDQFKQAYARPELVTVEMRIPKSELTSGYKAQYAKDAVGWTPWNAGAISKELKKKKGIERKVMLSRYAMPYRILDDSEVAKEIADMIEGTDIKVDDRVVTPSVLKELEKLNVPIERHVTKEANFSERVEDTTYADLGQTERIEAENKALAEDIARIKKILSTKTGSKKLALNYNQITKVSDYILKEFGSKTDRKEFADNLLDTYNKIIKHFSDSTREGEVDDTDYVMNLCYKLAWDAIENIPDEAKNEFSEYNTFEYGFNAYDEVKNYLQAESAAYIANEIYNKFWTVTLTDANENILREAKYKERLARADLKAEHAEDIKALKLKHRQAMSDLRAQRDEALANLRKNKNAVIKKLRQQNQQKIEEVKQHIRERDAKNRDNAERRAYIKKITETSKTLMGWMEKNNAKEHVPRALQPIVKSLLSAIDFSSKQLLGLSGKTSKTGTPKAFTPTKQDISIRTSIENIRKFVNDATFEEGMKELSEYIDLPPAFRAEVESISDTVNDIALRTGADNAYVLQMMTTEQLEELYKMVKTLKKVVTDFNQKVAGAYSHTIGYEAQRDIKDREEAGKKKTNTRAHRFFEWQNMLPVFGFEHLGKGARNMFREIQDGWDKFAFNVKQIIDFSKKTFTGKEAEEWSKHTTPFEVLVEPTEEEAERGGEPHTEKIEMTDAQVMSLYCLAKRKQARGHIANGGIRISTIRDAKGEKIQAQNVRLSETMLNQIIGTLNERQTQVADELQKFMNTVCSKWGNEVSMKRWDIKLFTEEDYFPIKVDSNVMSKEARDSEKSIYALLNYAWTKPLTEGAKAQIEVSDIFDVFTVHTSEMAKYNSLALPVLDMIKYYNYKETDNNGKTVTNKGSIEETYGTSAIGYINHFLADLNGNQESGRDINLAKRLTRGYKTAAVAGNLQVMLLQPVAITRATLKIDRRYILKAMANPFRIKHGIEEMLKNSGIAVWKDMSMFDTNLSRGLDAKIKQSDKVYDKVIEASMKGASLMDNMTWGIIWNACEAESRTLGLTGKEALEHTKDKFRDIIYHTQVTDSTVTRSDVMRSPSQLAQMITSFMSEPTVSMNLVQDAAFKYGIDARKYGKAEALRRNGKTIAKATEIYLVNALVESIFRGLIGKWRKPDDEDTTLEMIWKEFLENANPLANIPIGRDLISIFQGYDVTRMDVEAFNTIYKSFTTIQKSIEKGEVNYKTIYTSLQAISQLSGIPLSNMTREVINLWNNTIGNANPSLKIK